MAYFDWPSWMSRAGRETPDGANMLVFSADKESYSTGEKAQLSFPSAKDGRALISIENGKKVIDAFWIETIGSETSFRSEERRVGKECRCRWSPYYYKKTKKMSR